MRIKRHKKQQQREAVKETFRRVRPERVSKWPTSMLARLLLLLLLLLLCTLKMKSQLNISSG
jgi:uncharacterized membrane protein YdfJ with MMPL/SSD domain